MVVGGLHRDCDLYVAMFLLFIQGHLVTFKGKICSLFDQHKFWSFSFFSHLLCLLLCLYFTWLSLLSPCALLLPCLLPRGHHPLKAFPILFAVTDFQLVGLIPVRTPWSSLRTAWPCPGSWSTTRSHHQQVLLKCHHCHPPGTMWGWSCSTF